MYRHATFALAVLLALIVGVLIGGSISQGEAEEMGLVVTTRAVGTYQLATAGTQLYAMDTRTGELWAWDPDPKVSMWWRSWNSVIK